MFVSSNTTKTIAICKIPVTRKELAETPVLLERHAIFCNCRIQSLDSAADAEKRTSRQDFKFNLI